MAQAKRHTVSPAKGTDTTDENEPEIHAGIYAMDEGAALWSLKLFQENLYNTWFVDRSNSTITPGRSLLSLPDKTRKSILNELAISFVVISDHEIAINSLRHAYDTMSSPLYLAVLFFDDYAAVNKMRPFFDGVIHFPSGVNVQGDEARLAITALIEHTILRGLICIDYADIRMALGSSRYISAYRVVLPNAHDTDPIKRIIARDASTQHLRDAEGVVCLVGTYMPRTTMERFEALVDATRPYIRDKATVVFGLQPHNSHDQPDSVFFFTSSSHFHPN